MGHNPFSQLWEHTKQQLQQMQRQLPAAASTPSMSPAGRPNIVSNLSGNVTVMPYEPNESSYHLRAVTPDAQRRAIQAAQALLQGKVEHRAGYCAQSVMDALVAAGIDIPDRGHANQLDEKLLAQGFQVVRDGVYQPGDIVGWNRYGTRGAGARYGHVGFVTNAGRTAPVGRRTPSAENHPANTRLQAIRARIAQTLETSVEDLDALRPSFSFKMTRDLMRRQEMDARVEATQNQFVGFLKSLLPEELGSIIEMMYR